METRTDIYAVARLEDGHFYTIEKKEVKDIAGLTLEQFYEKNMEFYETVKSDIECSDCIYRIGDSGEVGTAAYAEEMVWYPDLKGRYIRDLTEEDRKAIAKAIEEAEEKHRKAIEQRWFEKAYYDEKNKQLQHLKEGMIKLIDNTLGYDMEWRLDNFEEAKRKVEEIEDTTGMINFFMEAYDYVRSLEDSDEWIEEFQEFGHDELEVRFCEKCGCMFCAGFYFPSFMYEREGVCEYMCEDCFEALPTETKEAWDEFYSDDGDDCYSEWGI